MLVESSISPSECQTLCHVTDPIHLSSSRLQKLVYDMARSNCEESLSSQSERGDCPAQRQSQPSQQDEPTTLTKAAAEWKGCFIRFEWKLCDKGNASFPKRHLAVCSKCLLDWWLWGQQEKECNTETSQEAGRARCDLYPFSLHHLNYANLYGNLESEEWSTLQR